MYTIMWQEESVPCHHIPPYLCYGYDDFSVGKNGQALDSFKDKLCFLSTVPMAGGGSTGVIGSDSSGQSTRECCTTLHNSMCNMVLYCGA